MKPSLPKGVRDFTPEQVIKRNYIFDTVKKVFVQYGFQPIETPTMEKLETLTGKYGDEGDQLLFKVLNNGHYLQKANKEALENLDSRKLTSSISKRGLRYDLTVPFARFVVMHRNDITFPFKRYQIQPVWRADRPQKGRYNEFYQCDVDVVGSDSLLHEVELIQIYDTVFAQLGLDVTIKVSNRKLLAGMADVAGINDKFMDMTVAIDKLDKVGIEGVRKEMSNRGISDEAIAKIEAILNAADFEVVKTLLASSEIGSKGIAELEVMHEYLESVTLTNTLKFDISLARGLSYYTGAIFEVASNDVKIGSIGGGGRYDDLTGMFGLKNMSGVGVSFGAARIFDVMEELNLFPKNTKESLKVLFIAFDKESHRYAFNALQSLRKENIVAELYPEPTKLKKQMKYANARKVPYVVLVGSGEIEKGLLTFKNMNTSEQESLSIEDIVKRLQ